jgi:hypothetical protein
VRKAPNKQGTVPFGDDTRWRIAEFYLKRSEAAANYLRALLFALASASFGFVLSKHYDRLYGPHLFPLILLALAICTIAWSWEVQKRKSLERFKTLRDNGFQDYKELEERLERQRRNWLIDRFTFGFLAFGIVAEVLIVLFCGTA